MAFDRSALGNPPKDPRLPFEAVQVSRHERQSIVFFMSNRDQGPESLRPKDVPLGQAPD
jgi:hypothetical protein